MTQIIDGKKVASEINEVTKQKVLELQRNYNVTPGLVVIIVGNDEASQRYVRNKHKTAQKLGINSIVESLPETISEVELLNVINKYNQDTSINGILVQSPLPKHIDETTINKNISPSKDVDGFHPLNVGKLYLNDSGDFPIACTPKGIITLLNYYDIPIKGQNVVVIGNSQIVGKPMAALLNNRDASVSLLHKYTRNIKEYTKNADIIISATGKLRLLNKEHVKSDVTIIDVGQNIDENGHLVGDADFESMKEVVGYITPVPGGVGPMTIATLMQQTVEMTLWSLNNGK